MAPGEQVPSVGLRGYRGRARYPAAPAWASPASRRGAALGVGVRGTGVFGRLGCALFLHTCLADVAGRGQGRPCEEDWRSPRSFPNNFVSLRGVPLCLSVYSWKLHERSFLCRNPFPFREDDLLIKTQSTFHPY